MLPLHEATTTSKDFTVLVLHHAGMSTLAAAAFEHIWADATLIALTPSARR